MARARRARRGRPRHDQPEPGGRRGDPRRRRARRSGRAPPPPPGGPHAEVDRAGRRPASGPAAAPPSSPSSRARTPAAPGRAPTRCSRPASPASSSPCPSRPSWPAGGADRLRAAGVDVELGVEQAEAEAGALAAWLTGVREHRPYVIWKVAATLDGRVAAADGTSRWITGAAGARRRPPAARHLRRRRRRLRDGAGRRPAADRPRRRRPERRAAAAAGRRRPPRPRAGDRPGARRRGPDAASAAPATPAALLAELFDRDVRRVLLEGGPTLAAAFLRAGLVDEVVIHLAPKLLGCRPLPGRRPGNQHDRRRAGPLDRRRHPPGRGRADPPAPDPAHWWAAAPRTEGVEVFTGIVEEVGTLVVREDQSRRRACCGSAPTGSCRTSPSATRSPSTASASR